MGAPRWPTSGPWDRFCWGRQEVDGTNLIRGRTPDATQIERPWERVGDGSWVESNADVSRWIVGSARRALAYAGHDPGETDGKQTTFSGDPGCGDEHHGQRTYDPPPEAAYEPEHWDAPDFKGSECA